MEILAYSLPESRTWEKGLHTGVLFGKGCQETEERDLKG
jgi:hypothetical protein